MKETPKLGLTEIRTFATTLPNHLSPMVVTSGRTVSSFRPARPSLFFSLLRRSRHYTRFSCRRWYADLLGGFLASARMSRPPRRRRTTCWEPGLSGQQLCLSVTGDR